MKNKEKNKKENKELELMIKSIKINNPGINEDIIKAFYICDRKFFVREAPYLDKAIHIAYGQTISQPTTIAAMINFLRVESGLDVLEIGTNTGYHAALVSYLVWPGSVRTIEIFPDLAEMARTNIKNLILHLKKTKKDEAKKFKIKIIVGDAFDKNTEIWHYKYDRIYFTAGISPEKKDDLKKMALLLLKEKGLLVYPTREIVNYGSIEILEKIKGKLKLVKSIPGYAFVPLLKKQDLEELYKK